VRDRADRRLILLLDENLSGHRIVEGLTALGIPVKPQTDIMARGIPDEEVLKALAQHPDCYLLTKDSDFHKKPMIKHALIEHGVGAFVITAHKNKTAGDLSALIGKAWHRIQRFAEKHDRPFVAKILADGRVEEAT
jgi:predicted nuclease of predicted toxin-antitoxin system